MISSTSNGHHLAISHQSINVIIKQKKVGDENRFFFSFNFFERNYNLVYGKKGNGSLILEHLMVNLMKNYD